MAPTPEEQRMLVDLIKSELSELERRLERKLEQGLGELFHEFRGSIKSTLAVIEGDFEVLSGYAKTIVALSRILVEKGIVSVDELRAEEERQGPKLADELKFKRILRESGIDETGSPPPDK